MQVSYNKEADALYSQLQDGECRSVRVTNDISLDFAAGEQLVGIEVFRRQPPFQRSQVATGGAQALVPQVCCLKVAWPMATGRLRRGHEEISLQAN